MSNTLLSLNMVCFTEVSVHIGSLFYNVTGVGGSLQRADRRLEVALAGLGLAYLMFVHLLVFV